MEIKNLIKKTLCNTCIIFTVVTLIYMMAVVFINVDDDRIMLDASRMFLFLVFSLLVSVANSLFKIEKLPSWSKLIMHLLLCGLAFYACMLLPISPSSSSVIIGLTLYVIVYFIVWGIFSFFRARYRKQTVDNSEYQKRFSGK